MEGKIKEILGIVMEINSLEARSAKKSGTLPTAFFDFSGHVANVSVSVYMHGWRENANGLRIEAGTESAEEIDEMLESLKALKAAFGDKNGNS